MERRTADSALFLRTSALRPSSALMLCMTFGGSSSNVCVHMHRELRKLEPRSQRTGTSCRWSACLAAAAAIAAPASAATCAAGTAATAAAAATAGLVSLHLLQQPKEQGRVLFGVVLQVGTVGALRAAQAGLMSGRQSRCT